MPNEVGNDEDNSVDLDLFGDGIDTTDIVPFMHERDLEFILD